MGSKTRTREGVAAAIAAIAALVVACSGGAGGSGATGEETFECATSRCAVDREYCLHVSADPKKGTPASATCIPNPCGRTMDCDCITADAIARRPTCTHGCDLRNTSGRVTHADVTCDETAM